MEIISWNKTTQLVPLGTQLYTHYGPKSIIFILSRSLSVGGMEFIVVRYSVTRSGVPGNSRFRR
jgi:hypothetical protein